MFLTSSLLVLAAIIGAFASGDRAVGFVAILWISALVPALLFAFYRGLNDAALVVAAAMCAVALFRVAGVATDGVQGVGLPSPPIALAMIFGVPVLIELRYREHRRANRNSLMDAVSGLPNREYFDLSLERAFAAARRGHPLVVVQFNIDQLTNVNTRFGRPAGTSVVQQFGKLLGAQSRREDLAVRYDDVRFVTLLFDTDAKGANVFASRVLEAFRRSPFPWGRQTASAGIAVYAASMESPRDLLAAADGAVARAKSSGRDMVALPLSTTEQAAMRRRSTQVSFDHGDDGEATIVEEGPLVYVVDDNASVRSEVKGALLHAGYRVWDTGDAEAAIRRFRDALPGSRPAVIIADDIMPAMSGARMIERMVEMDRSIAVVYLLSFGDGADTRRPGRIVRTVPKPLHADEVVAAVEAVGVSA